MIPLPYELLGVFFMAVGVFAFTGGLLRLLAFKMHWFEGDTGERHNHTLLSEQVLRGDSALQ